MKKDTLKKAYLIVTVYQDKLVGLFRLRGDKFYLPSIICLFLIKLVLTQQMFIFISKHIQQEELR
jgi:hypothetical protein